MKIAILTFQTYIFALSFLYLFASLLLLIRT